MHPAHVTPTIERNVRAHTVDGFTSWHMVAAANEKTIRLLAHELATLKGTNATAGRGCYLQPLKLGPAEVLVEVCSETHVPVNVLIGGQWLRVDDYLPDHIGDGWAAELAAVAGADGVAA